MSARRTIILAAAVSIWIGGLATGFATLEHYAATAGQAHPIDARGIEFLQRQQHAGRGLLVMAVHPRCPCTDASLAELGDLLARGHGACDALIVQYQPSEPSPDWPAVPASEELGGTRVPVI